MNMIRRHTARQPRGNRFRTGAGIVVSREWPKRGAYWNEARETFYDRIEAFAIDRIVDTGRLYAGSRTTTTGARDSAAHSSS